MNTMNAMKTSLTKVLSALALVASALPITATATTPTPIVSKDWFSEPLATGSSYSALPSGGAWSYPGGTEASTFTQGTGISFAASGEAVRYTPAQPSYAGLPATVTSDVRLELGVEYPDTPSDSQFALVALALPGGDPAYYVYRSGVTGWTRLYGATPTSSATVSIVTRFDYEARTVTVSVGGTTLSSDAAGQVTALSFTPPAAEQVTSVSFSGTGTLGDFLGIDSRAAAATVEGVNYETVAEAVAAAEESGATDLTITLNDASASETVELPAGTTLTFTGVSASGVTVEASDGAFLETSTVEGVTTYESKKITVEMAQPQTAVEVTKIENGEETDVTDSAAINAAVNSLMGNADVPRTDNTDKLDVLDIIEVTPTKIVEEVVGGNTFICSATFDVVPTYEAGQSLAEGQTLKFRLPVDAAVEQLCAMVYHDGAFFGTAPISSETVAGTAYKFIEVVSGDFSPYGYTILDGETANPVAIIGTTGYATLSDAITAANAVDVTEITILDSSITTSPDVDWNVVGNKLVKKTYVAQIVTNGGATTNKYESLEAAYSAATTGDTIEMLADYSLSGSITFNKSITLTGAVDAEGKPKYTVYGNPATYSMPQLFINSPSSPVDLTFQNLNFSEFGNETGARAGYGFIYISKNSNADTHLMISNVTMTAFNCDAITAIRGDLEIVDCVIDGADAPGELSYGIRMGNHDVARNPTLSIVRTVIRNIANDANWAGAAIVAGASSSITVSDCTITNVSNGITAIGNNADGSASAASVTIANTLIDASSRAFDIGRSGYDGEPITPTQITVASGTFHGIVDIASQVAEKATIAISGGTFDAEVPEEYCAAGYIPTAEDPITGMYTVISGYKVTFVDEDGTTVLCETNVASGTAPVYGGATPTKAATAQNTFTWSGWTYGGNSYGTTDTLAPVTAAQTYTATYSSVVNDYTVTVTIPANTTVTVKQNGSAIQPDAGTDNEFTVPYGTELTVEYAAAGAYIAGGTQSQVVTADSTKTVAPPNDYTTTAAVAQIGDVKYETLSAALDAAQTGDTVTLLVDIVNFTGTQNIYKSLTLDGAGYTISAAPVAADGHRDVVNAWSGSTAMFKLQAGTITIKNITLDGDATHAYTFLISADNSSVSLTTENICLLNGGELCGDANGLVAEEGAGYGAAIHLNNGASLVVKDGFYADTHGAPVAAGEEPQNGGVFPFTAILPENLESGTSVYFDLTDDTDANPTVEIGADLLLVGMVGDLLQEFGTEAVQGILDYMNVPSRFIPYTLTLGDGTAYAFTGASPRTWNDIIDYGKEIMDVSTTMGYEGLDTDETPVEVGLLTDTDLPDTFVFEDDNFTVNGNGHELTGTIHYTPTAGVLENVVLTSDTVLDITEPGAVVNFGDDVSVKEGNKIKLVIGEEQQEGDLAFNIGDLTIDDFQLCAYDENDELVLITDENMDDYLPPGFAVAKILDEQGEYDLVVAPKLTVTWVVEGVVVETDEGVVPGTQPSYDGSTPTKASDENWVYTFDGWTNGLVTVPTQANNLPPVPLTNAWSYLAHFSTVPMVAKVFTVSDGGATTNNVAYYTTLADAVAAAQSGVETTIAMIANESMNVVGAGVTIPAGKSIVLDLNGHTVSGTCTTGKNSQLILNNGTLVIKDSTDVDADGTGDGKLLFDANPYSGTSGSTYYSNLIVNHGSITVKSGYLQNTTSGAIAYVIDDLINGSGDSVTIEGGSLSASTGVRLYVSVGGSNHSFSMTGGTLTGRDGITMQGSGAGTVNVAISGGTINAISVEAPYSIVSRGSSTLNLAISGDAVLNGGIYAMNTSTINVTGGTINATYADYPYSIMTLDSAAIGINISDGVLNGGIYAASGSTVDITGGTFNASELAPSGTYVYFVSGSTPSISGGKFGSALVYSVPSGVITGGIYSDWAYNYWASSSIADGYVGVANTDPETMAAYPYAVVASYPVTFVNYDGTELFATNVVVGGTAVYEGATPTKSADANGVYTFSGWDPAITAVSDSAQTYTAQYSVATYVAQIVTDGGATTNKYTSLSEAVAAVPANGSATIEMLANAVVEGNAGVTIPTVKSVVLELNGFTVANNVTENKASQVIQNNGTLMIRDSSAEGTGKLTTHLADGVSGGSWSGRNYSTAVIRNSGVLTIESGTVEQSVPDNICYAIDTGTPASNGHIELNIEGGHVVATNCAIRIFAQKKGSNDYDFTMTGGTVEGDYRAISVQMNADVDVDLAISGGSVISRTEEYYGAIDQSGSYGCDVVITGGDFTGGICLVADSTVAISGGTFNENDSGNTWFLFDEIDSASISGGKFGDLSYWMDPEGAITGGEFAAKPDSEYIAPGYAASANTGSDAANYPWIVGGAKAMVVSVPDASTGACSTNYYASVTNAVGAVTAGQTVVMLEDETLSTNVVVSTDITLDLAGRAIERTGGMDNEAQSIFVVNGSVFTITNSIGSGSITSVTKGYPVYVKNNGTVNVQAGTITGPTMGITTVRNSQSIVNVSGGTVSGGTSYGVSLAAKCSATISGGTLSGGTGGVTDSGASLTISGGMFTGTSYAVNVSGGAATISGGTMNAPTALRVSGSSTTTTVSGGTIVGTTYGIDVQGSSTVNVSGGTVTGDTDAIHVTKGTLSVSDGQFSGGTAPVSVATGTASLSGGVYSIAPAAEYVADGYAVGDNADPETMAAYPYAIVSRIDIALATVTVATDLVYDGTAQAGVASIAYGTTNLVLDTDYTVVYADNVNAGTDTASAAITGIGLWTGTTNVTFSIAKRTITIKADDKTKVAGNADPEFSADITNGTLADGQTIAYTFSRESGETSGTYAITPSATVTASGTDVTANYDITAVDGTLTVSGAVATVYTVADGGATTNTVGYYDSLEAAYRATPTGGTIEMLADDRLSDELYINHSITITGAVDEHGKPLYTIYGNPTDNLNVDVFIKNPSSAIDVTIQNVNLSEFGHQYRSGAGNGALYISRSTHADTHVLVSNVTISAYNNYAIIAPQGHLDVVDCAIDGYRDSSHGDFFTGGIWSGDMFDDLPSSTVSVVRTSIINTGSNMSGTTAYAIDARAGSTVTVTDCVITNVRDGVASVAAQESGDGATSVTVSGTTVEAARNALAISGNPTYLGGSVIAELDVTSGAFVGAVSLPEEYEDYGLIEISGGIFDREVPEEFCATGYIPTANTDAETMAAYPYTVVPGWKVTFVNYDNSVLFTTNVVVGGTAVYEGATPTKPADANGSYTFSGWDPAVTAVTDAAQTYTATFTRMYIDPASLELYPNCSNYVYVVGAPAGSTYRFKFEGDIGSGGYSSTAGWGKPYGKTPGGTGTVTAWVTNNNVEVAQLVCNVTVKDVVAVVDGTEYTTAQWTDAVNAAITSGSVLEVYWKVANTCLEPGQTLRWKSADNRGQGKPTVLAAPATETSMPKVTSTKDNATGITTAVCTDEGAPNVMHVSADGVTTNYYADLSMTKTGTYTLLRDMSVAKASASASGAVTLDMNGKTLTVTGTDAGIFVYPAIGKVTDLTITGDGTVNVQAASGTVPAVWAARKGKVTIESGTFVGSTVAVYASDESTVGISNGTFRVSGSDKGYLLNCQDANAGAITVTGGSFEGFDPDHNAADGAGTSYVPAGYVSVADEPSSGWYTVVQSFLDDISWTGAVAPAEADPREVAPEVSVQQLSTGSALRIHRTGDASQKLRQIDANADGDLTITWATDDSTIAEIDSEGLLTFHDLGTVTVTITVTDAFGTALSASAEITYALWPVNLRITAIDCENRRLWYDMGAADSMASFMPNAIAGVDNEGVVTFEPIYCTIVTATDLTASEWTAVENSREWEANEEGPTGWVWLDNFDMSADRRFFRVAVTLEPLAVGDAVSFGQSASGTGD